MIAIGFIEAVDEVEAAGAATARTGGEFAGELSFRARCEGAGLLMAHMDPLDLALTDGVGDAVERVADDPVAPLYAGRLQRLDQYVGHPLTHRGISCVVFSCGGETSPNSGGMQFGDFEFRGLLRAGRVRCAH
jgi:hypothetical protein